MWDFWAAVAAAAAAASSLILRSALLLAQVWSRGMVAVVRISLSEATRLRSEANISSSVSLSSSAAPPPSSWLPRPICWKDPRASNSCSRESGTSHEMPGPASLSSSSPSMAGLTRSGADQWRTRCQVGVATVMHISSSADVVSAISRQPRCSPPRGNRRSSPTRPQVTFSLLLLESSSRTSVVLLLLFLLC